MAFSIQDELYARAIGWEVLTYLKQKHPEDIVKEVERDALYILEKIQTILNDETLNDSDCYEKIELIVQTFYANGLSTNRHDWG